MTAELIANEITADFDDRELNRAVAANTIQLRMAERDLVTAEAYALSLAASLGSNEPERKRNAVLYLAGQLDMSEEQKEAVAAYRAAQTLVDHIEHELVYLKAEQQSRRHERLEAQSAALNSYVDTFGQVVAGAIGIAA